MTSGPGAVVALDRELRHLERSARARARFAAAYGSGAADALLRVRDVSAAGVDGRPSPWAGLETARRRCFTRDAGDADVAAWRALADGRAEELRRVRTALGADADRRSRLPLRPLLIGGTVLALVVAGTSAALVSRPAPPAPARVAIAAPHRSAAPEIETAALVAPPEASGAAAITLVGVPTSRGTAPVAWAGEAVDPHDSGIALALRCAGAGTVEVHLTSSEVFRFSCTSETRTLRQASDWPHPESFGVTVVTTGRVAWGLRVVVRPVADLKAVGADRQHDLP